MDEGGDGRQKWFRRVQGRRRPVCLVVAVREQRWVVSGRGAVSYEFVWGEVVLLRKT